MDRVRLSSLKIVGKLGFSPRFLSLVSGNGGLDDLLAEDLLGTLGGTAFRSMGMSFLLEVGSAGMRTVLRTYFWTAIMMMRPLVDGADLLILDYDVDLGLVLLDPLPHNESVGSILTILKMLI